MGDYLKSVIIWNQKLFKIGDYLKSLRNFNSRIGRKEIILNRAIQVHKFQYGPIIILYN